MLSKCMIKWVIVDFKRRLCRTKRFSSKSSTVKSDQLIYKDEKSFLPLYDVVKILI